MIPTETLEIIKAVAHFRSFTAAAKHLKKVPSAISYTVRKLEDKLAVQLFLRDSKRVQLTPAGEHFVKHTDALLKALEELESSTQQMATGWEQKIHISLDNVVNQGKIIELISDLQVVRPTTELVINTEVYNGSWDALFHGRCQLVIGAPLVVPSTIEDAGQFSWRSMGHLSWDLVVAPEHPLADEKEPLSLEQIKEHRSISIQDTSRIFNKGYNLLLENQQVLTVPNFRSAIACLLKGLGMTILPTHFVQPYIEQKTLIRKSVPALQYNDGCLLAWNHQNIGDGLKWVLDWLGSTEQLNKVWLQHDANQPIGYHVP